MTLDAWTCTIGPIDRNRVPEGGDAPLRNAVMKAFAEMTGEEAAVCESGWGNPDDAERLAEKE